MTEKDLIKKIKKELEKKGIMVVKYYGNQFSQSGFPDLIIITKEKTFFVECKYGYNKPNLLQLENINRINEIQPNTAFWVNEKNWIELFSNYNII